MNETDEAARANRLRDDIDKITGKTAQKRSDAEAAPKSLNEKIQEAMRDRLRDKQGRDDK